MSLEGYAKFPENLSDSFTCEDITNSKLYDKLPISDF